MSVEKISDDVRRMLEYYTPDISAEDVVDFLEKRLGYEVVYLVYVSPTEIRKGQLVKAWKLKFNPDAPLQVIQIVLADADGNYLMSSQTDNPMFGHIVKKNSSEDFFVLVSEDEGYKYYRLDVLNELAEKLTVLSKTN